MKPNSCAALVAAILLPLAPAHSATSAREILEATGFKAGLIVHLGCADGALTAELQTTDSTRVHGLDKEGANIAKARAFLHKKGVYGSVAVERLGDVALPYADNLVNFSLSKTRVVCHATK